MMNRYKAVFFDMGNTLLRFHEGQTDEEKDRNGLESMATYLQTYNATITCQALFDGFYRPWCSGIKDRKTTFREYPIEGFLNDFLRPYGVTLTLEQCVQSIAHFYTAYREQVAYDRELPHILATLKAQGHTVGIISNTPYYDEVMVGCFAHIGIAQLVDHFTFSYGLKIGKPCAEIFQIALKKARVEPWEAVMVGDSLDNDITPAKALGMGTIWLKNGEIGLDKPDFKVEKLTDILDIL